MSASAPRPHPRWMKPFARLGYAARGVVYAVIAAFAFLAAIGSAETEDSEGALATLVQSPVGGIMGILLVVGLAGHSAWRLVQAVGDTDDHGKSIQGLAIRAGLAVAAFVYGVLAFYTISLWRGMGTGGGGSGGGFAEMLSGVVGARFAAWAIAIVLMGVAVAHLAKAWRKGYRQYIEAPSRFERALDLIARTGLACRGGIFAIIAVLFVTRGIRGGRNDHGTPGLEDALDFVSSLPFGFVLLGAIAAGLFAFSLYSFTEALWRRINVEEASLK